MGIRQSNVKNRHRNLRRYTICSASAILGFAGFTTDAPAAPITFTAGTTVTADSEVLNGGVLHTAFNGSNSAQTVNGVLFSGANSTTAWGSNLAWTGLNGANTSAFDDGGWGAFDADNTREVFTKVPFADHNAMIDPSSADITARILEAIASVGMDADAPWLRQALNYVWNDQLPDGAWFGRWGVNYLYGTWQVIQGLTKFGISTQDSRLQRGARWLMSKQQPCGGWGETPATYDDPSLRGTGTPTASQTAWAILGLVAAGQAQSDSVKRGIRFLIDSQQGDGSWIEEEFTGTGFPRVFYLRYHYYRIYFPLMALARYRAAVSASR